MAVLGSGLEWLSRIDALAPDLLIADIDNPDRDRLEGLRRVGQERNRPVVMFAQDGRAETIRAAVAAGVAAYVVGMPQPERVKPVIEVAIAPFAQFQTLRTELNKATTSLAERELVEKAKGILMKSRQSGGTRLIRPCGKWRWISWADQPENRAELAELLSRPGHVNAPLPLLRVLLESFAVALPMASRWYPPQYQGIVMGIAGAGNMGFRRRLSAPFDAVIHRLIEDRRAGLSGGPDGRRDLLARLVAARDDESGQGMSAQEIRSQCLTIFLAGHETTALVLTWTWYLLSLHPIQEARLHAELDEVLGGRAPTYDDLPNLTYTRMAIEESMRLYPPAPFMTREPIADDVVGGHKVPKGSYVAINPWVVHRHRRLWDHPLRFDPERFTPAHSAERPRFAYLPFGGGPRICLGASFAMMEAVLVLAALARKFRFRLAPGQEVEPRGTITLRPEPRHGDERGRAGVSSAGQTG